MIDLSVKRLDGPEILFTHDELADRQSGEGRLAPGFAEQLASLRMTFGRPMTVSSCCRSAAHNAAIGGHPRSLHVFDDPEWRTGGSCAIDIRCPDVSYAWDLARLALNTGWSVGVAVGFVHLDRRTDYGIGRPGVFGYGERGG